MPHAFPAGDIRHMDEQLLLQALHEADAELPDAEPAQADHPATIEPTTEQPHKSLLQRAGDVWKSVGGGIAKAGMETKDFVFGEPAEEDKWQIRKDLERRSKELNSESGVNAAASGVAQIVTGLIGAGKIMGPFKALQTMRQSGAAGLAAFEIGKAATASAIVLDPHEERLSNLIEDVPALRNPVTDYLAADPSDSAAEGRFKNALESIGLDFALLGAAKVIKLLRAGKQKEALKEIEQLEAGKPSAVDDANARIVETPDAKIDPSEVPGDATAARTAKSEAEEAITPTNGKEAALEPPGVSATGEATYRPTDISDEDLGAILKGSADEAEAIKKYGSKEAATEAGQVLSRTSTLPWQKLRGTEEVLSFVNRSARVLKTQMDAAKGGDVMSDAKVSDMVKERAALFGEDPAMLMGQLQEAGEAAKGMAANMEASFLVANRMFQETYDAAFRLRNGMLDEWAGDATKATEEIRNRLMASADLLASARSMSTSTGRAMRRLRGQFQFKPEDLAQVKGMDGQKLADLIYQTQGDPKKLAQMANPTFLRRVMDEATFSLTNSLLWLWPTHAVNMTTTALMTVGRPTEKLLGSLAIGPKQGGDIIRQQAIKEYGYTVAALGDAWTAAKDAFLQGDSILSPHNTEFFAGGGQTLRTAQQPLPWKRVNSITDLAYNAWVSANYRNIVGLPTRALGAADEYFKTLRYRAYVQGQAATKANQAGLKGEEFTRYVQEQMEKAIDPATGQALDAKALQEAQVATFQQELLKGTAGSTIQQVRARHPMLTFVLPFVKTPINVLRYSVKMTPGLNLIQKEFRDNIRGINGTEAQAHAYGQMTLGATFMGLAATLALNGKMTGGGPADPNALKELRATGWQPYAYVIDRPDGSKRYIPMNRLDPASMAMTMAVDLVSAIRHDPENADTEKGIMALALALGKNFSDRTFTQNLHQALEAVSDEKGDKGEKYLASIAGNTIPLSSALRGINPDPHLREARSFIDMTLKNVPGYSQTLPPSRDAFGEPVARTISLSTTSEADIVEAENTRLLVETGTGVFKPDPKFEGMDLRDITLSNGQNAYDRYQELAGQLPGRKSLKRYLANIIRSQRYQDLPDGDRAVKGTRIHALGVMVTKYREVARKVLVRESPELRALVKARQREARGAYIKNRQERQKGEPGARQLLEALGAN